MKKITGFFMAILPLFVLVLLFISGFVIKSNTTVHVSSVHIAQEDFSRQVNNFSDPQQTTLPTLEALVSPRNANNPEVDWISSNTDVVEVDKFGETKAKGYGEAYVYAKSQDDSTKIDRVKIEVYDTNIHSMSVANEYELSYVNLNSNIKIEIATVPADHIINKTFIYECDNTNVCEVTDDGLIIPKTIGTANITIKWAQDQSIQAKTKVNIGAGVERIEFSNQATTITDSQIVSLRNEIVTFPETDAKKITDDDFEYETSDSEIAESFGSHIYFKQPKPVTISAIYKRNRNLKISKTVRSTCSNILSVNFDANEYQVTLEVDEAARKYKETDVPNFKLNIYPTSDSLLTNLDIESSNKDIVEPYLDLENSTWKLKAKKPGTVTLLATAGDGSLSNPFMFDACLVKVLSPVHHDLAIITSDNFILDDGMFYFPLQKALSLDINDKVAQDVTFKIIEGDAATIDDNNILQFTKAGTVKVKVYEEYGYSTSATFTVTAKDGEKPLTYSSEGQTISIKAGQRYKFTNVTPVFEGSYASKFNVDNDVFSAICGQDINEFKVRDNGGNVKTIHLIVSEDPLFINYDIDTFVSTSEVEINFFDKANATIVPSTALKENGDTYKLTYTYTPATESTATIENNVITFKQAGLVDVLVECEGIKKPSVFKIKSTHGGLDKFDVYDGATKISSNYTKTINQNGQLVLTTTGLTKSEADQIEIQSCSDTKMCTATKEVSGGLIRGYTATFTITAPTDMYGLETFALKTKTFATYVNVNVTSDIQGFEVAFGNQILKSGEEEANWNTSFTNNLVLSILPYPIIAAGQDYTTTIDGQSIEHTNNKIKLNDLNEGKHNLVISWTNLGVAQTKTYVINYTSDLSKIIIGIAEADKTDNLYFGSNNTTVTFHLTTNGFVNDSFWTGRFNAKFEKTEIKATIQSNILTIAGLPAADGTEFSDKLILLVDGSAYKKYPVTRDVVSKIELPKHDNNDQTDKKGLQKVHVYGNLSYYSKEEGLIDFYKLPIKVYDYKGEEIKNTSKTPNAKTNAIKTLVLDIGKNCSAEYDDTLDCIKVKFSNQSLYDQEEIANNEFDAKNGNKNVPIVVSTKSKQVNANYTFVAVKGINAYDQEIFTQIDNNKFEKTYSNMSRTAVLQTNFGLGNDVVENKPLEKKISFLPGIYGNGYTFDYDWAFRNSKEPLGFFLCFAINVTLEGCNDKTYGTKSTKEFIAMNYLDDYEDKFYFVYSTYRNWTSGIDIANMNNKPLKFRDAMFYKDKTSCIMSSNQDTSIYLENCVFFDSGSFPILLALNTHLYFKGYIGIYNFHSKEMLQDLFGVDVSFLWPIVEKAAKANSMTEIGADGRLYINSFMGTGVDKEIYFWNESTKQYEKGTKGTPDAANFTAKYVNINIPLTPIEASLWATYNTDVSPNAFSYYQEFDHEGNIRPEFFKDQIKKVTRLIKFF